MARSSSKGHSFARGQFEDESKPKGTKPQPKAATDQVTEQPPEKGGRRLPALLGRPGAPGKSAGRAAKSSQGSGRSPSEHAEMMSLSSSSTSRPSSRGSSKCSRGSSKSSSSRGSHQVQEGVSASTSTASTGRESMGVRRRLSANLLKSREEGAKISRLSEEEVFLKVLDLLEQNDEFNSFCDDEASSYGEDEASGHDSSDSESEDLSDLYELRDDRELADWELEAAWLELQNRRIPSLEVCRRMIRAVTRMHREEQNVVHVPGPEPGARMVVVGDIHGHFSDLIHILLEHGEPQSGPGGVKYLFNGDFVDRGAWGPEVLLAIYCLKIRCPDCIFMNRGNHEDQQQNLKPDNGFVHSHCIRAFGAEAQRMYSLCKASFKVLPLCHVISSEVAVIHGGLSLDPGIKLADINAIDRKRPVPVGQCCVLGYPRFQKVVAKKDLLTEDGEQVRAGEKGKLLERVGKTTMGLVKFANHEEEVLVSLAGAPELETDITVFYETPEESTKNKLNRLFVALLWSDPVNSRAQLGPSKRGAGCCFDARITQEFLRANKLSLLLRSHEKRNEGFCEEHRSSKLGLMSATVFSASNYPGGAGEPCGNKAAVVVFRCPKEGQSLTSSLSGIAPWRAAYDEGAYHGFRMSDEMKARFQQIQETQTVGPRARALAKLRELIYCSRPKLLAFWQRLDDAGQGVIPASEWARAMRACVVPDDEFPWEFLMPFLLRTTPTASFNYAAYLTQYENALSRKLADQWHSGAVILMANNVKSQGEAEAAWNEVDRNGDGRLSYSELRPLLRSSALALTDAALEEDRVYSVLSKIDKDRTGFVCKHEFIHAVVRSLKFQEIMRQNAAEGGGESPDISPLGLKHGSKLEKRRSRNMMLRKELAKWDESDVANCWAATQGAVRALAATSGCASSVFQVLDNDSDGAIDRQEFQLGLLQLLKGSALLKSFEKWEPLLWKLVDDDGSGFVSPSELNMAFSVREFMSI